MVSAFPELEVLRSLWLHEFARDYGCLTNDTALEVVYSEHAWRGGKSGVRGVAPWQSVLTFETAFSPISFP